MAAGKPRIAKHYDKLTEELIAQIKIEYPFGFEDYLISYKNAQGVKISALPFETEEVYYLIRMTKAEAQQIIEEDEDYDDDGNLIHQSIFRYGAEEKNFEYKGDTFLAILINND